jgi:enoyl-CoA hydratase/3-hydroxyacyl-CoA dehydrogenase
MAKMMMDIGQDTNLQVAMTMESLAFANMLSTDDMREGSEAFLKKRRANFVGQ